MQSVEQGEASDSQDEEFTLFKLGRKSQQLTVVTMGVNGQQIPMEVDTGAAVAVISAATRVKYFPTAKVEKTSVTLTTYTRDRIQVLGGE